MKKDEKQKTYSKKRVAEVMEVLSLNSYNISKTHKETGIARSTLTRWKKLYLKDLALQKALKKCEKEIIDDAVDVRQLGLEKEGELIDNALALKKLVLKRIVELVPAENNMDRLGHAFKILHTTTSDQDPHTTENSNTLIFQQVSDQLIRMKKNDSPEVDDAYKQNLNC